MPAGLDGNPEPVVSATRTALLDAIVGAIGGPRIGGRRMLAIDGASGTGKSTLADELARSCEAHGIRSLRATIDSFHRPRVDRYERGADSAEGYYRDSHDLDALRARLLEPFRRGDAQVCRAVFDEPADVPIEDVIDAGPSDTVLIFDGLFLHRPELADYWDISVYLLAEQRREAAWQTYLTAELPVDRAERRAEIERRTARARRRRYVAGQAIYEADASPAERATFVVDNDDLARPQVLRAPPEQKQR